MKKHGLPWRRIAAVGLALTLLALNAAALFLLPLANNYASVISALLGQSPVAMENTEAEPYFYSDYESEEQMMQAAAELSCEVAREGLVLLRNEGGALPLPAGARVSLLGQDSVDPVYAGLTPGAGPDLRTALEETGFAVNPVLWDFYTSGAGAAYRKRTPDHSGQGGFAVGEVPQSAYTAEVLDSLADYADAAVVVIGRAGSPYADLPAEYLEFSAEERDLLQMAVERFPTVAVVLNTAGPMALGLLEELGVDACLWAGAFGQGSARAVGEALCGALDPSGRLPDTCAYDPAGAPAAVNAAGARFANAGDGAGGYLVYAEDIYVGYRYYETRYEDVCRGREGAEGFVYEEAVQYPFGYGLSYTSFSWSGYNVTESAEEFTVDLTVTNTGAVAGKDVVQVYLQSPYTPYDVEHHIEKPSVELVGFAKTGLLEPGMSETVMIEVPKQACRVYDTEGYGTYILEAGPYYLTAAANAHEAIDNILQEKADGEFPMASLHIAAETDAERFASSAVTGEAIGNQLAQADLRAYDGAFVYLSRSDWTGTWPTAYADGAWQAPETLLAGLQAAVPQESGGTVPTFGVEGEVRLSDLIGADFNDPDWETLLNELSEEETLDLIRHAGYGTAAIPEAGVPGTLHAGSPASLGAMLTQSKQPCTVYPSATVLAATWNEELAEARGLMIGEESLASGVSVWYAPAMNLHRTPLGGRNAGLYAEDSYLSGAMGAAETRGAQDKGCIVTLKNFVLSDQDTSRAGCAVFANERTVRSLYLAPFEHSVVNSDALGVMSGMDRLGPRWTGSDAGLMTAILRGEWGFDGFVITDLASFGDAAFCDMPQGLAAGNDLWLNVANNKWKLDAAQRTPTLLTNARQAAHRYLYALANSNAMNGVGHDTTIQHVQTGWQRLQAPLIAALAVLDLAALWLLRRLWRPRAAKPAAEAAS